MRKLKSTSPANDQLNAVTQHAMAHCYYVTGHYELAYKHQNYIACATQGDYQDTIVHEANFEYRDILARPGKIAELKEINKQELVRDRELNQEYIKNNKTDNQCR
jgi:hypothetical protein